MNNSQIKVSVVSPQDISSKTISAWIELEERAVEANAFLSPLFILPAIKYLDADKNILIFLIEKTNAGTSELLGVGVFQESDYYRFFPLRHLVAYKSIHSYLTGLLVDKDHIEEVLNCLYEFVLSPKNNWHFLNYESKIADDKLDEAEQLVAAKFGINWIETSRHERAMLIPSQCDESTLLNTPKKFRKNFERCMRRLDELGESKWQLLDRNTLNEQAIDNFIRLEDMGWKKEEGTSLASNSNDVLFFREMTKGFHENGRAFFTELSLNDEVIASTSNLISGNTGFAFKIGWNAEYAKLSPGILNEIKFIQYCKSSFNQLDLMDSGAGDGSFIDKIWPLKRDLVSGVYTTTKTGRRVAQNMIRIKNIMQRNND